MNFLLKNKNKILTFFAVLLLIFFVVKLTSRDASDVATDKYIFDKESNVDFDSIKVNMGHVNFSDDDTKSYFGDSVANKYTFKFFKSLETKFKNFKNLEDHFEAVRKYLFSILPADDAEKLFALYKKFVKYELDFQTQLKKWGTPKNGKEAIAILRKIQEYRRSVFGKDIADKMFGADIKSKEYPVRRKMIVYDKNLYGDEKLAKIKKLNKDMWGNESNEIEESNRPYDKYRERLDIYSKDFSELSADDKKEKIKEIRKEIFSPEVVERLEKVDEQIESEKQQEANYREKEQEIQNDPNLTDEEKQSKVTELQNETFGKDVDAFRRRENIRKNLEKNMPKKLPN